MTEKEITGSDENRSLLSFFSLNVSDDATLCICLTLLHLLTRPALIYTTCRDGCDCFHLEKASSPGISVGGEQRHRAPLCPRRAGSVASKRWKNGISSSGGGEGQAGGAGERAPLRVSGALHNLVTKELLRVEPLSVRSGASLRHRPRGKG